MAAGAAVNAIIPFILLPLVLMVPQDVRVGDVVVSSVFPGSPGSEAGLRPGDRVMKVDGREISTVTDLQSAITLRLGAESHWEIMRGIPDPFAQAGGPVYQYTADTEEITVVPRWRPPQRQVVKSVDNPETQLLLGEARIFDPAAGISDSLTVVSEATDTARQISLTEARALNAEAETGDVFRVVLDSAPVDSPYQIPLSAAREINPDLGTRTRLQEGAVGIQIATQNIRTERRSEPVWLAFPKGAKQAWDSIVLTRNAITGIAVGSQNPQFTETPTFTGPVGIGQLTGEIAVADAGFWAKVTTLASLAAIISFSLAVLNILPIPALDGGRIFFVLVEIVRGGKRISPEREGLVHLAGMVVLLVLIAIISVQDIGRIFRGESFF
jgi:regulator of sigma E protease